MGSSGRPPASVLERDRGGAVELDGREAHAGRASRRRDGHALAPGRRQPQRRSLGARSPRRRCGRRPRRTPRVRADRSAAVDAGRGCGGGDVVVPWRRVPRRPRARPAANRAATRPAAPATRPAGRPRRRRRCRGTVRARGRRRSAGRVRRRRAGRGRGRRAPRGRGRRANPARRWLSRVAGSPLASGVVEARTCGGRTGRSGTSGRCLCSARCSSVSWKYISVP